MSQEEVKAVGSFEETPNQTSFENQLEGERIVLLLRRHWYTNIKWFSGSLAMLFFPAVILNLVAGTFPSLITLIPLKYQLILTILWYLAVVGFIFEQFLMWYFNVYIVTNRRIIDVDFVGLFYKQISETEVDKVQDITYQMSGLAQTFLNFENVIIQTAGETPNFEFHDTPYPASVQHKIRATIHNGGRKNA